MKSVCIVSTLVTLLTFWIRFVHGSGSHPGHIQRDRHLQLLHGFEVGLL